MWIRLSSGLLVLLCVSCSGGGEDAGPQEPAVDQEGATPPAGFQFGTSESLPFDLVVQLDGVPVAGAVVQLVDIVEELNLNSLDESGHGQVFFAATTNASGEAEADVSVPLDREQLDLVVDLPGASGPYTSEDLRTEWGLFAPSSRTTLDRSQFSGLLSVELTSL